MTWHYLKGKHSTWGFLDVRFELTPENFHWFEVGNDRVTGVFNYTAGEVRGTHGLLAVSGTALGMKNFGDRSLKGFLRRIRRCPYFRKGDRLVIRNWYVGYADVLVII